VSAHEAAAPKVVRPQAIVVPLDGSSVADAALPVAYHLAAAFRAGLQRVTVIDGDRESRPPVDVELEGDPAEAILAHLEGLKAPVVVMSSHGRGGWSKRRIGSVAEQIVRRSRVPVVVVGPKLERNLPLVGPRSLLVAVGNPPVPENILPATAGTAVTLRASVVLAHVVSPEVAEVAERAPDEASAVIPDLEGMAGELRRLGVVDVGTELVVSEHRVRSLVELSDTMPPPVLLIAQAHPAELSDQADKVTYKLIRHSRWPILATVGRA
jgi:nucleotide-binding universal stress UspA family protein